MDYLDRKSAPLTDGEWARVDQAVVETARTMLVARRVTKMLKSVLPIPKSLLK